jgi:hypothetical protein
MIDSSEVSMDAVIIGKIKKIQALADRATTDAEKLAALGIMQKEMDKHSITRAMLETEQDIPEEPLGMDTLYSGQNRSSWREGLGSVVSGFNGCALFHVGGNAHMIGQKSDCEKVKYLFQLFSNAIDRLSAAHTGHDKNWHNSYRLGCVDAIHFALKKNRETARTELRNENLNQLMVIDSAIALYDKRQNRAQEYLNRKAPNAQRYTPAVYTGDPMARTLGQLEGKGIVRESGPALGAGRGRLTK